MKNYEFYDFLFSNINHDYKYYNYIHNTIILTMLTNKMFDIFKFV